MRKKLFVLALLIVAVIWGGGCSQESPTESKQGTSGNNNTTNSDNIKEPTSFIGKDTLYAIVNDSAWFDYDFFFNNPYGVKPVSIDTTALQFAINGFQRKKLSDNTFEDSYINFWMYPYDKTTGKFDSTKTTSLGTLTFHGTFREGYSHTFTVQKAVLTISLFDASKNRAAGIFEILTKRDDGKMYAVKGFFEGGDKK